MIKPRIAQRLEAHPILGPLVLGKPQCFQFDGEPLEAREGETIAAALLAYGIRTLRVQEEHGTPRGIYCNIGHCFECRVTVDGLEGQRACLTIVRDGMKVQSGKALPTPFKKGDHS